MVKPGPKPGFRISEKTKEKMRLAKIGQKRDLKTRQKISKSLSDRSISTLHRDNISQSMSMGEDKKCWARYQELVDTYPEHLQFFEENQQDILEALYDIKSEKELDDILKYYETADYRFCCKFPYQYESSSVYAQEDVMIKLLDTINYLRKFH